MGEPLNYATSKIERVEHPRTVCGAEECRGVPRSAESDRVVPGKGGADVGVPLNFQLLYYHCKTTKIDRVEQPRTACGASTTIEIPLK